MAKQTGPTLIEGCFGNVVFYKLGEYYYARMKSSLSGKRVKKDPAFKKTMEYAGLLANASTIASEIYRLTPLKKKERGTYRRLVGRIMNLLREEKTKDEIIQELSAKKKTILSITIKKSVCEQQILFANSIIQEALSMPSMESEWQLIASPG
jgi:hypothetical protein